MSMLLCDQRCRQGEDEQGGDLGGQRWEEGLRMRAKAGEMRGCLLRQA